MSTRAAAIAIFFSLLASAVAEEPEFQVVGTVERQTLSLSILPRPGFRLGTDTPVLVRLTGTGVELPRRLFRRADAVDPRAEAPRFEVPFRPAAAKPAAKPGAKPAAKPAADAADAPAADAPVADAPAAARIDAELTFYICKAARCRPVETRYGTNL